uniref:Galectin domain-containing protein n=1 Tax=Lutzomyia longipalpis TaxID=7200 RepID=A0A1B0CR46_LUTLO
MAALAAIVCNTFVQAYQLTCIFVQSGGSLRHMRHFLIVQRKNHKIHNYLQSNGLEASVNTSRCYLNTHPVEFSVDNATMTDADVVYRCPIILEPRDGLSVRILGEILPTCERCYLNTHPVEFSVDNATMADADVVYRCPIILEPRDGLSVRVLGEILPTCERFSINLVLNTPERDIALHINPRLPQNYIVRNSRVGGVWGNEERTSALPFSLHRGSSFIIQILFTTSSYLISVNGRHVAAFVHRLPFTKVKCVEVKGDVHDVQSDQVYAETYPEKVKNSNRIQTIRHLEDDEDPTVALNDNKILVPFFGRLQSPFKNGHLLHIRARLKLLPHSFYINLQMGDKIWPHPLIYFHFNARFANTGGRHIICQNSWMTGDWGREERSECPMEFVPGKVFDLRIASTLYTYNVFLDGCLISEFILREGDAQEPPFQPDTVYVQERDIALHINPRLPQNYIVRNSRVGGVWGNEERTSALPFSLHRGSSFIIQILFTTSSYLISVNGRHVAAFAHRLPFTKVKCVEVKGDVHDVQSDQVYAETYPEKVKNSNRIQTIRHLEDDEDPTVALNDNKILVPFYGRLQSPFKNGHLLHIRARLKLLPHSFYINLQMGDKIWPHPLIYFHFNARFANTGGRHIICQNSWMTGDWGREERSECPMEFVPGKVFDLRIASTLYTYNVFLDGCLISEFILREGDAQEPSFQPDTVYVQGDIQLLGIYVQNTYEEYPIE